MKIGRCLLPIALGLTYVLGAANSGNAQVPNVPGANWYAAYTNFFPPMENPARERLNQNMREINELVNSNVRVSQRRLQTQLNNLRADADRAEITMNNFMARVQQKSANIKRWNEECRAIRMKAEQEAKEKRQKNDSATPGGKSPKGNVGTPGNDNAIPGGAFQKGADSKKQKNDNATQAIPYPSAPSNEYTPIFSGGFSANSDIETGVSMPNFTPSSADYRGTYGGGGVAYDPSVSFYSEAELEPVVDTRSLSDDAYASRPVKPRSTGKPQTPVEQPKIDNSENRDIQKTAVGKDIGFFAMRPLEPIEKIFGEDAAISTRNDSCPTRRPNWPLGETHRLGHVEFFDPINKKSYGYYDEGIEERSLGSKDVLQILSEDLYAGCIIPKFYDVDSMQTAFDVLKDSGEWTKDSYNLFSHNCQHFAVQLAAVYDRIEQMRSAGMTPDEIRKEFQAEREQEMQEIAKREKEILERQKKERKATPYEERKNLPPR